MISVPGWGSHQTLSGSHSLFDSVKRTLFHPSLRAGIGRTFDGRQTLAPQGPLKEVFERPVDQSEIASDPRSSTPVVKSRFVPGAGWVVQDPAMDPKRFAT